MWAWHFFDAAGGAQGSSHEFEDAESAEAWLGEIWPILLERGIEEVALSEDSTGDVSYRMSLREA